MQENNPLWHAKHVFRCATLLLLGLVILVLGRTAFVPDSWGQYGWFRGDNVAEQRAHPITLHGDDACKACHEDKHAEHAKAEHKAVRCESCHAPVMTHVDTSTKNADMRINRSKDACLGCHRKLDARPATFPQVEPRKHVEGNDGEWGEEVCIECHQPHAPL